MFSILINQAIQECNNLEKQISELYDQMVELEQAIRELRNLSCMEEPISKLEHQYSEMDFQHTVLRQMMLGLNKIILDYMNCENRICDNSEQNVTLYTRQEIGINDFSNISNILSGI